MYKSDALLADCRHGFFSRNEGVSAGIYESLNCGFGSNDEQAAVAENRRRVAQAMGADQLLTVHQIHSPHCVTVKEPWAVNDAPEADAMVTDRPGVALGVLTADCAPVLFAGEKQDGDMVVGAAHAGWGGALGGVLESVLDAMTALGTDPDTIRAVIGPCIGPQSYEVSDGFERPFIERHAEAADFFRPADAAGHLMFDLPAYVLFRLRRAGIDQAAWIGCDTYAEEKTYFSYRRATHRKEPDYGRQISCIIKTV